MVVAVTEVVVTTKSSFIDFPLPVGERISFQLPLPCGERIKVRGKKNRVYPHPGPLHRMGGEGKDKKGKKEGNRSVP